MTIRFFAIVALFVLGCYPIYAQGLHLAEMKEVRQVLRKMGEDDQYYRHMIATENNSKKADSLWKLQAVNDSINKLKLLDLIGRYGYPSFDRTGAKQGDVMVSHYITEGDSLKFYAVFDKEMQKGNMTPEEFARWYDQWRVNNNKSTWYGVYGVRNLKKEDKVLINKRRRAIGLPEIKP